jgi:hypothetical protein
MTTPRWQEMKPAWYKQAYFIPKPFSNNSKQEPLRTQGKRMLSLTAQLKLEWIIFYHTQGKRNATRTATHFGITRKTIHKWLTRYNHQGLIGLEESA